MKTKQDLVSHARHHFLREHPEYRDRARLPGWEQAFRSRRSRPSWRTAAYQLANSTWFQLSRDGGTFAAIGTRS
jgi:hypothetical protein